MPKKSAPRRVLVVDDEPLIRWWIAETLGERGCAVVEAGDGREAVQAIATAEAPFDVVLLDFRLPDSSDLALLSRLRAMAPDARIILMTAYGTPEVTEGALDRGAYRVVSKPFQADALDALISDRGNS